MSIPNEILDEGTCTFEIPVTAGQYAPLKLTLRARALVISATRLIIESALPAGAVIEAWLLKFNGNPNNDADYTLDKNIIATTALVGTNFGYPRAIQLRAKSGGASGTVVGHGIAV